MDYKSCFVRRIGLGFSPRDHMRDCNGSVLRTERLLTVHVDMKVYSMPEAFMGDQSVPIKWRLYGLLNGFWINGLTVYAANKHFSDKLGCTERHVRRALEELEVDKLVRREINGHNRVIYPGGRVESAEEDVGQPPPRTPDVHPMHSINASNKLGATRPKSTWREDTNTKPKREPRNPNKQSEELCRWAEARRGFKFVAPLSQYKALTACRENDISITRLKNRWMELEGDSWRKDGFDWWDVFKSFNKKA